MTLSAEVVREQALRRLGLIQRILKSDLDLQDQSDIIVGLLSSWIEVGA